MDEVQLEHRLGLIEATIDRATRDMNLNHSAMLLAVGKIEGKIETQNGIVKRHEEELIRHADVPHSGIAAIESTRLIAHINEMWTAWSIGKFVGSAFVLALTAQSTALLIIVLRG